MKLLRPRTTAPAVTLAVLVFVLSPKLLFSEDTLHRHQQRAADSSVVGGSESTAVQSTAGEAHEGEGTGAEEKQPPTWSDFLFSKKYLGFMILMLLGLVLLVLKGINFWVRLGVMALAFVLYGLDQVFASHPSPMCAFTKLFMFRFTWGEFFTLFVVILALMLVPSLFVRKLFCGWVCPLGALQELINKVPFRWRWKQFKFGVFNGIRFALLLMFVLTFFWVKDHIAYLAQQTGADVQSDIWRAFSSYSVYSPINFFELLHWNVDTLFVIMFLTLVIGSLILYRPFCYAICPIGAVTWLFEKVAPGRVRVDRSKCNSCTICEVKSPCPTIKPMYEGKSVLPDCTSCGECVRTCPKRAIRFGFRSEAEAA